MSKHSNEHIQIGPFRVKTDLTIPNLVLSLLGIAYVSGYIIHTIYLRTLGIHSFEFIKSQYLESGIFFLIVCFSSSALPFIVYYSIRGLRQGAAGVKPKLLTGKLRGRC
jgi:hypothetical protein